MSKKNKIKEELSKTSLFSAMPEEILDELAHIAQEKIVPAHTIIFKQGDPGNSFYIINSGGVRVYRKSKDGIDIELARLGPDNSFGEMALITGEPRVGYVEALEETRLTVISKEHFDQILKDYPQFSSLLLKKLSNWLARDDMRLEKETAQRIKAPGLSWFDLIIISFLSLLFGITFNLSNPDGIELLPKSLSIEAVPNIAPPLAIEKYKEGKALFVDARPSNFFEQQHIKGAINLPLSLFDIIYMMELSEVDREKEIIVYGRTISRLYDKKVAEKLILRGHKNTKILEGGLARWEDSLNLVQ
jgi:CRP-like cAMP-binding protein/rhodanese-related sulfurtransferase